MALWLGYRNEANRENKSNVKKIRRYLPFYLIIMMALVYLFH